MFLSAIKEKLRLEEAEKQARLSLENEAIRHNEKEMAN